IGAPESCRPTLIPESPGSGKHRPERRRPARRRSSWVGVPPRVPLDGGKGREFRGNSDPDLSWNRYGLSARTGHNWGSGIRKGHAMNRILATCALALLAGCVVHVHDSPPPRTHHETTVVYVPPPPPPQPPPPPPPLPPEPPPPPPPPPPPAPVE